MWKSEWKVVVDVSVEWRRKKTTLLQEFDSEERIVISAAHPARLATSS